MIYVRDLEYIAAEHRDITALGSLLGMEPPLCMVSEENSEEWEERRKQGDKRYNKVPEPFFEDIILKDKDPLK